MSATLVVRHTVADYAAWREVYDTVEPVRTTHGCTGHRVLRDPADANDVFITHEFPSVANAQAFTQDPDFGAAMKKAGVTSAPRIEIFQSV
jgi:quinol monooxygenase YgiN